MKIAVLGAGESGAGAAVLAKVKGMEVFVSDMSAIKDNYKELLESYNIAWEEGRHTESLILDADEVIKSPGIPNEAPLVQKLMAQGTPIISEIEFAGRYTDAKMICITGSNGKTTTTYLVKSILEHAGKKVGLVGTIETIIGEKTGFLCLESLCKRRRGVALKGKAQLCSPISVEECFL